MDLRDDRQRWGTSPAPGLAYTPTARDDSPSLGFRTPPPRYRREFAANKETPQLSSYAPFSPSPSSSSYTPSKAQSRSSFLPLHCDLPTSYSTPPELAPVTPSARFGLTLRRIGGAVSSPFSPGTPRGTSSGRRSRRGPTTVRDARSGGFRFALLWALRLSCAASLLAFSYLYASETGGAPSSASETASTASARGLGADARRVEPFRFRSTPPPGSPSRESVSLFRERFGTLDRTGAVGIEDPLNPGPAFVLMSLTEGGDGADGALAGGRVPGGGNGRRYAAARDFALGYEKELRDRLGELWRGPAGEGGGEVGVVSEPPTRLVEVTSYYGLMEDGLPHLAEASYASPDGRTSLIEIKFAVPSLPPSFYDDGKDQEAGIAIDHDAYVEAVRDLIQRYGQEKGPEGVTLGYTGLPFLQADINKAQFGAAEAKDGSAAVKGELGYKTTPLGAIEDMLPPTAPSLLAYVSMSEVFGYGRVSPYRVSFSRTPKDKTKRGGGRIDKGHENEARIKFETHWDDEQAQSQTEEVDDGSAQAEGGDGAQVDTEEGFDIMHSVMQSLISEVDNKVDTEEEKMEEEIETVSGIAAVNLESIPQRIEDGHMYEHMAEVMDELFGKMADQQSEEEAGGEESAASGGGGSVRGAAVSPVFKPYRKTTYDGIAFLRNNLVPFPVYLGAALCAQKNKPHCPIELLHLFMHMTSHMTSKDGSMTYVTAMLGVDTFSDDGTKWLEASREKILEMEESGGSGLGGFRVTIEGGASSEFDVSRLAVLEKEAQETLAAPSPVPADWTMWAYYYPVRKPSNGISLGLILSLAGLIMSWCVAASSSPRVRGIVSGDDPNSSNPYRKQA